MLAARAQRLAAVPHTGFAAAAALTLRTIAREAAEEAAANGSPHSSALRAWLVRVRVARLSEYVSARELAGESNLVLVLAATADAAGAWAGATGPPAAATSALHAFTEGVQHVSHDRHLRRALRVVVVSLSPSRADVAHPADAARGALFGWGARPLVSDAAFARAGAWAGASAPGRPLPPAPEDALVIAPPSVTLALGGSHTAAGATAATQVWGSSWAAAALWPVLLLDAPPTAKRALEVHHDADDRVLEVGSDDVRLEVAPRVVP